MLEWREFSLAVPNQKAETTQTMHTQKLSTMKLIEAELQNRVKQTECELQRIETIVRLSEVRSSIEGLQQEQRKAISSESLPPTSGIKAS